MPLFDPNVEATKTAHRIGTAMKHSVKIGTLTGTSYGLAKTGYYKARQGLAKTRKKKRAFSKKAALAADDIGLHASRGALLGFAAKFAAGPAALGYIKGQNVYHMAAHKAGRHKRRAEKVGTPGFDAWGFPIKARKAPSPKAKRVISGLLKAKNEDIRMNLVQRILEAGGKTGDWTKYAKWSNKALKLDTKLKKRGMDKAKLKGIAAKAGTDTLVSKGKKLVAKLKAGASSSGFQDAIIRKTYTGSSTASDTQMKKAVATAANIDATPRVIGPEMRRKVTAVVKRKTQVDFGGHGRSLGKNEGTNMPRKELIDATIDYVITQISGNRSTGPAHIRQQEREVMIEAIIESTLMDKMFIPKNEKQRKKLAKRSTAGHIAHGALRGAVAAPFALGPGVFNVLRYASKVDAAKKGYHRNEAIEAILEVFQGKIYARQDRHGTETVVQKKLRQGFKDQKVPNPTNKPAVTTIATSGRPTRRYASNMTPAEIKGK